VAPEAALYGAVGALARRIVDRGGRRARIAQVNLGIALPESSEAERRELARRAFTELLWAGLDLARAGGWSPEQLRERVDFDAREHIDKALAAGCGCLVLIPHLSSLELALRAAPAHGVPITVMTKPASNPLIDAHLNAQRERAGARVLAHRGVAKQALRVLREGRLLVISNDQYERRSKSVKVPFFGVRVPTGRGLATLSLRTGAPVVPFYITREDVQHSRMVSLPPIEPIVADSARTDVEVLTERYNRAIEGIIREHPEQYLWSHKRFRHSPDLPRDVYDR
jgi:KDO2-lipid IV(A) lauroyltransferase